MSICRASYVGARILPKQTISAKLWIWLRNKRLVSKTIGKIFVLQVILLIKIILVHIRDSYYKYFCHFYGTLDLQKLNMKGNKNNIIISCLFLQYLKELNILSIQSIILVHHAFRRAIVVSWSNKKMYASQYLFWCIIIKTIIHLVDRSEGLLCIQY